MNRHNIQTLKHLVSVEQLSNAMIHALIDRAIAYKNGATYHFLEPKFVANMFFENSTRTRYSLEMAEKRLGIKSLDFDAKSSSASKGESLYDAALTMSALGVDALVIRTQETEYYEKLLAKGTIQCSVINAGDGTGQHPLQSLMDLMTIYECFQRFEGLRVGIVGDIDNSRVANSNMHALKELGAQVYFSGPKEWQSGPCYDYGQYMEMDEIVEVVDVLMVLREQPEKREIHISQHEYFERYGLTLERAAKMKKDAIIMHPGPINRNVEIADELVEAQQSKIIEQMKNGVFMDMAILESVLA